MFQEQAPSCVLVGVLTRERVSGACLRSKLLRVYWLEYLPGSVFRERVSGASSLVCTGLYRLLKLYSVGVVGWFSKFFKYDRPSIDQQTFLDFVVSGRSEC